MVDENSGADQYPDLFGDPWQAPKETRGRKAHVRSPQIAEFVALSKATGGEEAKDEAIAKRVGVSVPTLKKYYFRELKAGPSLARQALIGVMWRKAMAGNVGAAKWVEQKLAAGELDEFLRKQQAAPAAAATSPARPAPQPKGKKEAANEAAKTAGRGSEWGEDLQFPKH